MASSMMERITNGKKVGLHASERTQSSIHLEGLSKTSKALTRKAGLRVQNEMRSLENMQASHVTSSEYY